MQCIYPLDVHHAFGQGCWFSCHSVWAADILQGGLEDSQSCQRAIKNNISLPCATTTAAAKQWKCCSIFLNSVQSLTSRAETHQEMEMTPTAKQSVFIILQTKISSGIISKRVIKCNAYIQLTLVLFDNSKTSSQIKCSACKTKQRDSSHACVLVNTAVFSIAQCARRVQWISSQRWRE